MQSPRQSALETVLRALFNYCTALAIQLMLFPRLFHSTLPIAQNLGIGLLFMANSIIGGYVFRRMFNRIQRAKE